MRSRSIVDVRLLLAWIPLISIGPLAGPLVENAQKDNDERAMLLENLLLVDGTGSKPIPNARILIEGDRIRAVGINIQTPPDADRVDLAGQTVMPGLVDCHFHIESDPKLALRQLANGVTAFRDPGEWLQSYEPLKRMMKEDGLPGPIMSVCGPHIDGENPAYPEDAVVARSPEEAAAHAERNLREGADAIKIYFRLPLPSVRAVVDVCRRKGARSTAHLEILDPREALRAGVEGIEHITSVGQALVSRRRAEQYRQTVLKENAARRAGRYQLFSEADLDGPDARELYASIRRHRPFIDPTLAVFELRPESRNPPLDVSIGIRGFQNMKRATVAVHRAGARIVLGGHTAAPFAGRGEAPWRELELLVESGLTPLEAIRAATLNGAQFLQRDRDFGTIQPGKLANLLVIDGKPHEDLTHIRRLSRVMLYGCWLDRTRYANH